MGRWKGEYQQQDEAELAKTFKTICDVSSLGNETNKRANTDLSATTSSICQTTLENISSNIACTASMRNLLWNLSKEDVDQIRKTMIRQEELFKEQVQTLHKLYSIQRSVMHEIRKIAHTPAKLSAFHTAAIQVQDDKGLAKGALKPGCVTASHYQAENHIISTTPHKSISHSVPTEEDMAKNSGQKPLWDSDKIVTDSAVIKTTSRRTIDLERLPEEYINDLDDVLENQEAETREAKGPDQGTVTSAGVSDTITIQLGRNDQPCARTGLKEKHPVASQREGFRRDVGLLSEGNKCDKSMLSKRLRQPENGADLLTEMKPAAAVQVGQQTSTAPEVLGLSGRTCLPRQLNVIDEESSDWETTDIDQVRHRKKEKWSVDTKVENKPSHINSKPPLWFLQASTTCAGSTESDSSQKPSWMPAPTLSQPQGWDFVVSSRDSLRPGQETSSPSKDVKMPGTTQTSEGNTLNLEVQSCGEPARIQEAGTRQPNGTSLTVVGPHTYGGASQLTSVVFTQGYPVGAAFPAFGLQWSLEGLPGLASQGFVFPTVNKSTDAGPVLHPASAAWYPQGTYFQLYQYQQQTGQEHGSLATCQGASQISTQNIQDASHRQSDTHGKPTSQMEHFESSRVQIRQSHEESSSVNWPARHPQVSNFSLPKPPFDRHHMPHVSTTVELKLASNEDQRENISESKTSNNTKKDQFEDPSRHFAIEEKRQIDDKASRCSNHGIETPETEGQKEEETSRAYKQELQATEVNLTEEAIQSRIFPDESRKGDTAEFKPSLSCKGNCSLKSTRELQTRTDATCGECSVGQNVSESLKELELFTDKICFCKTTRLEKHAFDENSLATRQMQGKLSQPSECSNVEATLPRDSSDKMPQLSLGKDEFGIKTLKMEICTSKILVSKESYKNEELDSSGHGSNNIMFLEGRLSRGEDSQHLDHHKETHTGGSSELKATKQPLDEEQINMDLTCGRSESIPLKRTECALTDEKNCSDGLYCQASIISALPSDEFFQERFECHGSIGETTTRNTNHLKSHDSSLAFKIGVDKLDAVKQVESGSGEITVENIQTGKFRYNDQNERFTDIQIPSQQTKHAQSPCAETHSHNQHPELQGNHPRTDILSSQGMSSEATESRQESSTSSQESEEISEETCENLAAKILLSLAPSASQIKGMSKTSASSSPKSALQQQGQFGNSSTRTLPRKKIKQESSHSSGDSTCDGNGRTCSSRGNMHMLSTHRSSNATQTDVTWMKSVRGRRRRTRRPRTQFVFARKNR